MKKDTYIVFGEWEDDFEDLNDQELAALTRAFFKYVRRGEKSTFEDRMVRSCWRKVQQAEDRANSAYEEKCEQNRLNGQKGGAPKGNQNAKKQPNNRTVEKTTETTLPDRDPDPDRDPQRDRGRGGDSDRDREAAAPQDTTTTTFESQIVQAWNQHDFVQKIKRVDNPQKRMERTEMAVAVAGGRDSFLDVIRSLDQQAYLKNQPEKGYKVIYDWLIQPDTFQALMEGRYKDNRSKYGDDWEVIDLG